MYAVGINHQIVKRLQQKCKELRVVAIPNIYLKGGAKIGSAFFFQWLNVPMPTQYTL